MVEPEGERLAELQRMDAVRDIGASVDLPAEKGFGKVVLDFDNQQVRLYWKGAPPPDVFSRLGTQPNGVELVLEPAVYSDVDLLVAGGRILDAGRLPGGLRIQGVARTPSMSGLIAEVTLADLAARSAGSDQSPRRALLEVDLSSIAGVPVDVVEGAPAVPTTRQNDSPPWQGGGAMRIVGGGYCTTGFAVLNSSGQGRLLSAAHCDTTGNREIRDGTGTQQIAPGDASVDIRIGGIDSMIIDPSASPGTIGKVFGGAFNQAPGTPRYEYNLGGSGGVGAAQEGDEVCLSGANSGEHCNKTITDGTYLLDCPGNPSLNCNAFVYGASTGITVAQGDSGGPIYVERSDGRVGARGIQSAGRGTTEVIPTSNCPNTATGGGRCFRSGVGISVTRILDYWRANGHPGLYVEFD